MNGEWHQLLHVGIVWKWNPWLGCGGVVSILAGPRIDWVTWVVPPALPLHCMWVANLCVFVQRGQQWGGPYHLVGSGYKYLHEGLRCFVPHGPVASAHGYLDLGVPCPYTFLRRLAAALFPVALCRSVSEVPCSLLFITDASQDVYFVFRETPHNCPERRNAMFRICFLNWFIAQIGQWVTRHPTGADHGWAFLQLLHTTAQSD
jgi:hypothetical protein